MVQINVDLNGFRRDMSRLGRSQVPFAAALALNDTAKDVDEAFGEHMDVALDRPTPFTKRGTYIRRASKARLVAEVGLKRVQAEYLALQITGGERRPKGQALVVPAGIRLNKYGNIARGAIARSKGNKNVFVASRRQRRSAHLPAGIYQRQKDGAVKLLVSFEASARYGAKLHPRSVAKREVALKFGPHFRRRFAAAILTAR